MKLDPGFKDLGRGGVTQAHQNLSDKGLKCKFRDTVEEASGEVHA